MGDARIRVRFINIVKKGTDRHCWPNYKDKVLKGWRKKLFKSGFHFAHGDLGLPCPFVHLQLLNPLCASRITFQTRLARLEILRKVRRNSRPLMLEFILLTLEVGNFSVDVNNLLVEVGQLVILRFYYLDLWTESFLSSQCSLEVVFRLESLSEEVKIISSLVQSGRQASDDFVTQQVIGRKVVQTLSHRVESFAFEDLSHQER